MNIQSLDQIRQILGAPNPILKNKIYPALNPQMRTFIQASSFILIATVDRDGFPTISPKGDHAGFVQINDHGDLLIPERKGNKLAFSLDNLLCNPKVAILFVVRDTHEVLRVHGTADIWQDEALNQQLASTTQPALLVTRVQVNHCYFHCGKALLRSQFFDHQTPSDALPISFGQQLADQGALATDEIAAFDAGVQQRYQTDL